MAVPLTQESGLNRIHEYAQRVLLGTGFKQAMKLLEALDMPQGGRVLRAPSLGNSTTALAVGALTGVFGGMPYQLPARTVALTTSTHNVAQDKWASFRVSAKMLTSGATTQTLTATYTITKAADVNTELLAIGNLAALPSADDIDLGFFTVRGGTATLFTAGTTNLQSGGVTGSVVNFYLTTDVILTDPVRTVK